MVNNRRKIILSSIIIFMFFINSLAIANIFASTNGETFEARSEKIDSSKISLDLYDPINTSPLNVEEQMTLSPMFTPDNALDIHAAWIEKANTTIEVQNQYITQFDDGVSWANDPNPVVQELVAAAGRGVNIRVQVREDADSDAVAPYLDGIANIEARYMGSSSTSGDSSWISNTHNKLIIIDSSVTLVSSINFGENAFLNNREAGMVVQSTSVANYFLSFFNEDWDDGDTNVQIAEPFIETNSITESSIDYEPNQGDSFTDIPRANFSGIYNISAYVNPDNADQHILKYLQSAEESIYVSMYTISREDLVDELVELKQNNPALDIQVLISRRRVGGSENVDTQAAALELVENLIPVYNSTDELNFYHNKYWIIDQKHTFIYSGNWSPRSLTPVEAQYSSSEANRDMGISVHDAQDIADWIKTEVWDKDVAEAVPYDLPIGITQSSFEQSEVISGQVTLSATVTGLTNPTVNVTFGSEVFNDVTLTNNVTTINLDTTDIDNGITTFTVVAKDENGAIFDDEVTVNVANYPATDNFRLLITEIHANPDVVSDTEGEFIELTNSFPFALLLEDWQIGDNNDLYTFEAGYQIAAYTSIIIARDPTGFNTGFGETADIELSFSLTNTDDYVQLLNQAGEFVDVVAYGTTPAPDGSQVIPADFDAGESISRINLHIDTDTTIDFTFEAASPKGPVPEVELGEIIDSNTQDPNDTPSSSDDLGSDSLPEVPLNFWMVIVAFIAIPILRRK